MRTIDKILQVTFFVSLLLHFSMLKVKAQYKTATVVEVDITGARPALGFEERGYFISNDGQRSIWFFKPDEVWSFNVDSLVFTQHQSIRFDDFDVSGGFDDAADQFLFWSRGIGKVYSWTPGQPSPIRIDSSTHHRTQYDHSWFIHPNTSDLYAFGGYGYWQYRGYTSRFEQAGFGWQVLPLHTSERLPSPRSASLYTYDPKRDQFHIFGGRAARNDAREDISVDHIQFSDYWILDINASVWEEHPIYGIHTAYDPNRKLNSTLESKYIGVIDTLNELAWYPLRYQEEPYEIRLMAFDSDRKLGALTPISLGILGLDSSIYWYYHDATANQLLIFWSKSIYLTDDRQLRVSTFQLPTPDSTRSIIDAVRYSEPQMLATTNNELVNWLWVLTISLFAIGVFVITTKRGMRRLVPTKVVRFPEIKFCFIGEPTLYADNIPLQLELTNSELGLLFWLYWKNHSGMHYQITDDIESALWNDSPNIDYLRKQRNRTFQGLNTELNKHFAPWLLEREWLSGRTCVSDKRKREYSLNLSGFVVKSDLDAIERGSVEPSNLLENHNGLWVEQIRRAFTVY